MTHECTLCPHKIVETCICTLGWSAVIAAKSPRRPCHVVHHTCHPQRGNFCLYACVSVFSPLTHPSLGPVVLISTVGRAVRRITNISQVGYMHARLDQRPSSSESMSVGHGGVAGQQATAIGPRSPATKD